MDETIVQLVEENRENIVNAWMKAMKDVRDEHRLTNINEDVLADTNRQFVDLILSHIGNDAYRSVEAFSHLVDKLMKIGLPLNYLTQGLQTFRRSILETCFQETEHAQRLHSLWVEIDNWFDPVINQLVTVSAKTWEETVSSQRHALKELSAPLIPVFEGISVMPLVGTIDTERAKLIMENLLEGVIDHRAQVVLIDITGVPVVDTMVAHHIIKAAEAVRLVGSRCILVGIRPEIAQTIVNLGIDLSDFPTKSTLKKGMQTALEMTERQIAQISGGN
ncbi:MAG TPA: STAS domain-containing protein [Bacillales bacterium]|nr:STAS domain-containing protein [Bacillales bacterium]